MTAHQPIQVFGCADDRQADSHLERNLPMNAKVKTPFAHPDCYARDLRDCSRKISREHYVSGVVLRGVSLGEPFVLVQNLSFQQPNTLEGRGINSLVAKVVCEKHNGALSDFDDAGNSLFLGMDRMDSAAGIGGEHAKVMTVNGDHLERWMLKILCGGLYSGNISLPRGSLKGVCPPQEWLNILFREGLFPAGQGLYLQAGTPGVVFSTEPAVLKMAAVIDKDDAVIGLQMWVFNFEYLLVLASLPTPLPPALEHAYYRPTGLIVDGSRKSIRFAWEHRTGGDEVRVRWVGHK
jgi:hypothetical protein